jgi:hypothetical protein
MKIAKRTAIRKALKGEVLEVQLVKGIDSINIEGLWFGHSVRRTIVELIRDKVITSVKVLTRFNDALWFEICEDTDNE